MDQKWSRERAVVMVWIKHYCFPMIFLQDWILGEVYEYKDMVLLRVRRLPITLELKLTEGIHRMKKA